VDDELVCAPVSTAVVGIAVVCAPLVRIGVTDSQTQEVTNG
jgi:hypothetical protein